MVAIFGQVVLQDAIHSLVPDGFDSMVSAAESVVPNEGRVVS